MRETISKILESAVYAPSGSNSQPWRFRVSDGLIYVYALPEKDHPVLNFRNRGTWVAHGALIENIAIASREFGYRADIELSPDRKDPKLTAKIRLEKAAVNKDPLFSGMRLRTTNRKPYKTSPLAGEQKKEFLSVLDGPYLESVKLITDSDKMKALGEAMSINEVVMLDNQLLHKLFFNELVWSERDEKKKGTGLYLKTMELKPPQQFALRIFKHWPVMNLLNKVGLAKSIASDNAKGYASASAIGAILVENNDHAFITAGRAMERLWLKATGMGLSFHLVTGVLFLWQGITAGEAKGLSTEHIELIKNAYQKMASIYDVKDDRIIALLFRLGYGGEPTARSSKLPPDVVFED